MPDDYLRPSHQNPQLQGDAWRLARWGNPVAKSFWREQFLLLLAETTLKYLWYHKYAL